MAGRTFEQWEVGDRIAHDLRRTVTETDNLLITTLTHNPQPLHLDADYAATTEFGRIVVNGLFTLCADGGGFGRRHHLGHAGRQSGL